MNDLIIIKILIFNIEMGDIKGSMNPGIGAPCSGHRNFLTGYNSQSFLNRFLNRNPIGLYLPAVIGGAIIGELNKISLHWAQYYNCNFYMCMRLAIGNWLLAVLCQQLAAIVLMPPFPFFNLLPNFK